MENVCRLDYVWEYRFDGFIPDIFHWRSGKDTENNHTLSGHRTYCRKLSTEILINYLTQKRTGNHKVWALSIEICYIFLTLTLAVHIHLSFFLFLAHIYKPKDCV